MDLDVDIMPDLEAWVEHLQDVTRASLQTVYLLARHQFPELSAEEAADKAGDLFRGLLVRAVGTAGEAFKYSEEAADGGACQADTRSPASGSGLLPWQHMPPGSLNLRLIHFCKWVLHHSTEQQQQQQQQQQLASRNPSGSVMKHL
jgi:hypothetical protein